MKRILRVIASTLLLSYALLGRVSSSKPVGYDNDQQSGVDTQSSNSSEKADHEKKKRKNKGTDESSSSQTFSEEVAATVIERFTKGFEDHNERVALSAFDSSRMDGYLNFQNQLHALFQSYDAFRVHYRMAQVTTDDQKGVAMVDFELEESPGSGSMQPVRKQDQLRFEMERGDKGWKIVDVTPRTFFS